LNISKSGDQDIFINVRDSYQATQSANYSVHCEGKHASLLRIFLTLIALLWVRPTTQQYASLASEMSHFFQQNQILWNAYLAICYSSSAALMLQFLNPV